ncbi:hypothetical protein Bca4012_078454 [Brassica carinata]
MKMLSAPEAHQVFLNYRGEQLRYSFVSHLIEAFERHGINFFVDKYEQRGKDLKDLFVRIKESRIALAIFSTRYAESSWCMDELVKMKKQADKRKIQVIPVFYKVRARDVRRQTGEFGDNFWNLAKASSGYQIKKWKEALECISGKMGLSLRDERPEADFIKEIVKEVVRVIVTARVLKENETHSERKRRKDYKYEQRGKDLENLFERIKESRIALAIFSTRYAESSWCMDELVKMKKLADKGKIQVIPIFYKVRACDVRRVRRQTGEFGDNFWNLAKASSGDQIKKWKEALECISGKMGLSLKDESSEADLVKEIVKEVVRVVAAARLKEVETRFEKKKKEK